MDRAPVLSLRCLLRKVFLSSSRGFQFTDCIYIVAEYFFDILLQDYINSLKAFYHRSQFSASESIVDGIYAKWPSTQKGNTR